MAVTRIVGGFWLAIFGLAWLPWPGWVVLIPMLGICAYKLTIIMHDCGHGTLFASPRTNRCWGRLCASMVGSDFDGFTYAHWRHHQYEGTRHDPQGPDYLSLADASRTHLWWHLLRPLLGANAVHTTQRYTTRLTGDVVLMQALIATAITAGWSTCAMALVYPLTAATLSLWLSQTRGFAEHVPMRGALESNVVRSHAGCWFDRLVFFTLNFQCHAEHHANPRLPSYYLRHETVPSPSVMHTLWVRLYA